MTLSPEQLQYACDLANETSEREDGGAFKCKVGKPCNGKCIPQNHKCSTGLGSGIGGESKGKKIAAGVGAAALGAAALAGGAYGANKLSGGALGRTVGNTALNAAESGIRGANNVGNKAVEVAAKGLSGVAKATEKTADKIKQTHQKANEKIQANPKLNDKFKATAQKNSNAIQSATDKVKQKIGESGSKVVGRLQDVDKKKTGAANKGLAYVRAKREKLNTTKNKVG